MDSSVTSRAFRVSVHLLRLEFEYVPRVTLPMVVHLPVQSITDRLDADFELALDARSVERHH